MKRRAYDSLQDWMERTGTSQVALSKLSGIKVPHLSKILSRSRRCSLEKALMLSFVTGVPVEKLVEWKGVPKRKVFEQLVKHDGESAA